MEYVSISPPFIHSARPLDELDFTSYEEAGSRIIELCGTRNFSCGIYKDLGHPSSAKANSVSLYYHQIEQQNPATPTAPFAAIFDQRIYSQEKFESLLRLHLQKMNLLDQEFFESGFFMIPSQNQSEFEYSFGGRIYAVKTYHPQHHIANQRAELVMLVFSVKYGGAQVYSPIAHYSNSV